MQSDRVYCERRMLSQKILVSFVDLPKILKLPQLKSQKTEVNETLFAAAVPMKKEADTRVLQRIVRMGVTRRVPSGLRAGTDGQEKYGCTWAYIRPKSVRESCRIAGGVREVQAR